jgi:hypothetical protein
MSSKSFALGVADRRRGVPPQFHRELPDEGDEDEWDYERGRLFASIAPASMPRRIGRQLNPKAVALCRSAFNRGYIR